MEPVQLAAILSGAVLLASMVSIRVGVSVALIELAFGVALGNTLKLDPNQSWLVLIASFAPVVLTFLASAEVDPDDFRERLAASLLIGVASFAGPFIVSRDAGRARNVGMDDEGGADRGHGALEKQVSLWSTRCSSKRD